ncbi:PilN domain-containing protein [Candidatus Babeliales bacterium]|nr:PilN domain-containing protein [Candidatus Babeliales bacterium]
MSKNYCYIEIKNSYLFLSNLIDKKDRFTLKNNTTINLDKLDFIDGNLYNPSKIFFYIKNFFKKNKIKNIKAIVYSPDLNNSHNLNSKFEQKLRTLQIALCLSKTGLLIETIISNSILKKDENSMMPPFFYKKDVKNQINFFKEFTQDNKTSPNMWLSSTIVMLLIIIISFFIFNFNKKIKLKDIKISNTQIEKENQILKNKIKQMHLIKDKIDKNKKIIAKTDKLKATSNNPVQILNFLSMSTPPDCLVNNFNLDNKKKKLEINGATLIEKNIPIFLDKFSKLTNFKNLKIAKIEHIKNKNTKNLYKFCIQGQT